MLVFQLSSKPVCSVGRPLFDSKIRMIPRRTVVIYIYTGRATTFLL